VYLEYTVVICLDMKKRVTSVFGLTGSQEKAGSSPNKMYHEPLTRNDNAVPWITVQDDAPAAFLLNLFTFIKDEIYCTTYDSSFKGN
jgi:hypothetical protein